MAPHNDDRSASNEADLSSLYRQRKGRHPAPEHLNSALLDTARAAQPGSRPGFGWKGAVSSAAAAMVVVVLSVNWLKEPEPAISGGPSSESASVDTAMAEEVSESSKGDSGQETASILTAPMQEAQARSAEPAESGLPKSAAPAPMADQALQFDALQAEPTALQPRFLRVIEGEGSEFEQCDGSLFQYDIPAAPGSGWFEVEWSEDGAIRKVTSRGDESPCPDS